MDGFDSGVGYDPGYSSFEATQGHPGFTESTWVEDPLAYALPPVVDAPIFDASASNAAVGFAMNEAARAAYYDAQAFCETHGLPATQRDDGWLAVDPAVLAGLTRDQRVDYYYAQNLYELEMHGRIVS